jgi:hypothetical protein
MLNAPKGQAGIHDSHPVQVSLLINNLAIRFSSYLNWKIGMLGEKGFDGRVMFISLPIIPVFHRSNGTLF